MRVLFVCSTFPPIVGGAETYARMLVDGVRAHGHTVDVVTDGTRVDAPPVEHGVHWLTKFAEALRRPDKVQWQQMHFAVLDDINDALASDPQPDLIHANGQEAAVIGAMIALETGVPLIATFHEQSPEVEGYGQGRCRLVYQHLPIRYIIAGSRFYYDKAVRFGAPTDRVRIIYHGVLTDRLGPATRISDRDGTRPHIVCLARLKARKGLLGLVEAAARLRDRGCDFAMTIAGTCSSASMTYADQLYDSIARHALGEVVTVDEGVGYHDVPALLSRSDIYVQPSLEEGLGLGVLEAMAAGLPVAGSAIPALQEIINDGVNGLLFEPGQVESLTEALYTLLRDSPLCSRLAVHGRATVASRFSAQRMVEQTVQLYYEALGPRPEPARDGETAWSA